MRLNLKATLLAVVAIVPGVIVLLGYFIEPLVGLRASLLRWAVILAAIVLWLGVVNLARVHWRKFSMGQEGGVYSLITLASLGLTVVVVGVGFGLKNDDLSQWVFEYIQMPIASSLMALLAIILAYALARLLNRRINLFSLIFVGTVLLVLVGTITFPVVGEIAILRAVRTWIAQVPATAGARGILLGVALGTVATGLRVLMGADRPYGG
jgi:hypothetical protein